MESRTIMVKNNHGEEIYVKLVDGCIMVHHTDCVEDFITINDLILKYIIEIEELVLIYNSVKKLYIEQLTLEINK